MVTKPQVYISSSLQIYDINAMLDTQLRNNGISVFLPQRDCGLEWLAKQPSVARQVLSEEAFDALVKWVHITDTSAISSSNALVAVAQKLGKDSAYECGYAFASGMGSILVIEKRAPLPFDHHNSFSYIIRVQSYSKSNLAAVAASVSKLLRGEGAKSTKRCKVLKLKESAFEKPGDQSYLSELDRVRLEARLRLVRAGIVPGLQHQELQALTAEA